MELAPFLTTVASPIVQKPILIGVKEQVASRLIAARVPEVVVNARRRRARTNAQKKGYTPSHAHLALLAWTLFITVEQYVLSHPSCAQHRDWYALADQAVAALRELYQRIGEKHLDHQGPTAGKR